MRKQGSGSERFQQGLTHGALWSGLVVVRWVAWLWMVGVLVVNRHDLLRPWLAWALAAAAGLVSVVAARDARRGSPPAVALLVGELAVGWALVVCDGWAYAGGHVFTSQASLGSTWPLAGVVAAGLRWGPLSGVGAGLLIGAARVVAAWANEVRHFSSDQLLSLGSTAVLWALAGGVAGLVGALLRSAEQQVAASRAREELGRTLHDGVLQTLALVQKRGDHVLVGQARKTEQELRAFLGDGRVRGLDVVSLESELRRAVGATAAMFEGPAVRVVLASDLPTLEPGSVIALVGAVRECLVNAAKHAGDCAVTVFGEPSATGDGVVVVVRDDGLGFDPEAVSEGLGMANSVRARIREVGGSVVILSAPGRGTEVVLTVPSESS